MTQEKRNKHNWKLIAIRTVAVLLLIAGLAMVFNKQIRDYLAYQNQTSTLNSLTKEKIKRNQTKKGMFDFAKVGEMDFAKVTKTRVKNTADAVGAIAIPGVKLYLPIMLGLSDDALSTGGGTMRSDQVMGQGNYPLAGHYMTSQGILFSPLENTKIGQKVYLTDLSKIYVYKIYYKKVVDPYQVWLVDNTKQKIVTLITCADGGVNRWAVRGKLIKTMKASNKNLRVFKLK